MDNKIKLLVVSPNKSGVGYYRSTNPHIFMDEFYSDNIDITITETINTKDDNFGSGFDIMHVHVSSIAGNEEVLKKVKQLQKSGVKIIVDLDDYWMLPSYFNQYKSYNKVNKMHEKIIDVIKNVDFITTTTEIFAAEIRKHNKNVAVIPNAIDPRENQFQKNEIKSDRLRVGIICGSSHEQDVEILRGVANKLKSDIDKIQFVICGFDLNGVRFFNNEKTGKVDSVQMKPEETVWVKYEKVFTDNYTTIDNRYKSYLQAYTQLEYPDVANQAYRRFWTKPVNKYATHYNNIDVLLAPLVENKFDECKSQLKVIEAAFFNKAVIAQNFGPYKLDLTSYVGKNGEVNETGNGLLVDEAKNHKQWAKHIKFLLNNPEARLNMANNLSEKITKEYSLETVSKKRFDLYKTIANK